MNKKGFTLIELLVVISIIGILVGISIFGLSGARESSRDTRRKSDLEMIRAGLEIYKADCNTYPASLTVGSSLVGTYPSSGVSSCPSSNTYISLIPDDPISDWNYFYRIVGNGYELFASLEQQDLPNLPGVSCGSGISCNYKITNP